MWTRQETELMHDPRLVDRLMEAGVLERGISGLATTRRWQDTILAMFRMRRNDSVRILFEDTLLGHFPQADVHEIGLMARIMLVVEAGEAQPVGAG